MNAPDQWRLRSVRVLAAAGFGGTAIAAITWWHLMPGGFPVTHLRFWVNSALPPVVATACLAGVVAAARNRDAVLKGLLMAFATLLAATGITAKWLFPISLSDAFLEVVAAGWALTLALFGLALLVLRNTAVATWARALGILAGALLGIFLPWSQRSLEPATQPGDHAPLPPARDFVKSDSGSIPLSGRGQLFPSAGWLRLQLETVTIDVEPLLSFESRSPDRFWTVFAPRSARVGPQRNLLGVFHEGETICMDYEDDGHSRLRVDAFGPGKGVRIEACSHLPQTVYSHLNSYCELRISGPGRLALAFSPCPEIVEMMPSDYPIGRPARLAYLDAKNGFHVVEAGSGEKGPFRTLAEGRLQGDDPLKITVFVDKKPVARIMLYDWARQASRQISPTAGWGLPENAIEFSLFRGGTSSEGAIYITLAGTSVGRGWDSVGHAAGTYRNMMTIEPVSPAQ